MFKYHKFLRNRLWLVLICTILCITIGSCSAKPTYYSKSEVKKYVKEVFGTEYKMIESKSYKDENNDEKNMIYEYIFKNKKDHSFSVYSSTDHVGIDGNLSNFYHKNIYDDYIKTLYLQKEKQLKAICEDSELKVEFGETAYANIYINNYRQLEEAGKIVAKIDKTMDLKYDYTNLIVSPKGDNRKFPITLFYCSDSNEETDVEKVNSIYLSNNSQDRWTESNAYEKLEKLFVANAKRQNNIGYDIPQSLWDKYPADTVTLVSIEGKSILEEKTYQFSYDDKSELYWINNLDPCQDFQEFPYTYSEKGSFKYLVEMLGGTYSCNDWEAVWTIGKNTWKAKLKTQITKEGSEYEFKDFIASCNGKKLELSKMDKKIYNGTVSGRAFTIEDLELLLNVEIEINQDNFTAKMVLK